ncbi:MAG: OmpA family protein [Aliivibrio sp.]|nr:OmpA family protein [Aliivibrio sp.]
MNHCRLTLSTILLLVVSGCATDTYVSSDNIDKYDESVHKFLIQECLVPEREIHIAVAEHFDFDQSVLKKDDYRSLDQFSSSIKGMKGRIAIVAHTDYQGSNRYNEQLSKRRAESIKQHISNDLHPSDYQWELKYYGETKPLIKGVSLKANAANRRAYLVFEQILEKDSNSNCLPPEPKRKVYVTSASHFEFDKSELNDQDKLELDAFATKLHAVTGRILIAGHTDYQGAKSYNKRLAKKRALAVQNYLQSLVETDKYIWEVKAFGEDSPMIQEHNLKANALNRRAFVVFTEREVKKEITAL